MAGAMALAITGLLWSMHSNTVSDCTTLERMAALEKLLGTRFLAEQSDHNENEKEASSPGPGARQSPKRKNSPPVDDSIAVHLNMNSAGSSGSSESTTSARDPSNEARGESQSEVRKRSTGSSAAAAAGGFMAQMRKAMETWKQVQALSGPSKTQLSLLQAYRGAFGPQRPILYWLLPLRCGHSDPCPPHSAATPSNTPHSALSPTVPFTFTPSATPTVSPTASAGPSAAAAAATDALLQVQVH